MEEGQGLAWCWIQPSLCGWLEIYEDMAWVRANTTGYPVRCLSTGLVNENGGHEDRKGVGARAGRLRKGGRYVRKSENEKTKGDGEEKGERRP